MPRFDTVEVCIDLERFGHPVLMGLLHRQQSGSGEIFSFEYDKAWLEQPEVFIF
jgi:serine/threonine-protein kinase HipA